MVEQGTKLCQKYIKFNFSDITPLDSRYSDNLVKMHKRFIFLLLVLLMSIELTSQSTNINCATAFNIADPTNYCSGVDEFDNTGAGESEFPAPLCWNRAENDLWFKFTATAVAVNIAINGEAGGDLKDPQLVLYVANDCNMVTELSGCVSTLLGDEVASIFQPDLTIGQSYFIRASGRGGREGSFQLCINSYNPPIQPGQDCETSTILCDKNAFVVQSVTGAGNNPDEAAGTCLEGPSLGNSEDRSTWFKWTCETSGTLTFNITPLNPVDDLDFALFKLNGGIENCNLEPIRCSATFGGLTDICGVSTGLDLVSNELEEDLNCDNNEDGFVKFIDMIAGESYALVVNNFSDSQTGFSIDFGGSGTFQGPIADFEVIPDPNAPCGTQFVVNDLSSGGLNAISNYEWDFGEDALPPDGTGQGPFNINYTSGGEKFIVLKVISDLGCQVTTVKNVNIDDCPQSLSISLDSIGNAGCEGIGGGYIEVSGTNGCPNYMFNLNGGVFSTQNIFSDLDFGDYTIGMMDMNGCEVSEIFSVMSSASFIVNAGDDISLDIDGNPAVINANSTATGITMIQWSPTDGISCSDGTTNCLNPTVSPNVTTTYVVSVTDENGCVGTDMLTVFVDPCTGSQLEFQLDSIQALTCVANTDGYIEISGVNGVQNYEYSINGGAFNTNNIFSNLGVGQYNVGIRDANGCIIDSVLNIAGFPNFTVNAGEDITFGKPGDTLLLDASTTASNISSILWDPQLNLECGDGTFNCLNPIVIPNTTISLTLTVTDSNGCTSSDDLLLVYVENTDIYAPNIFSPNEDGINDYFNILSDPSVVSNIELLTIFDRWGNKVFEASNLLSSGLENGWDGRFNDKAAQPGVYTWVAKVRYVSRPDGEAEKIKGNVTLIR